ncbi:hypothetical protein GN956_G2854 [Arapaima gigas]
MSTYGASYLPTQGKALCRETHLKLRCCRGIHELRHVQPMLPTRIHFSLPEQRHSRWGQRGDLETDRWQKEKEKQRNRAH